jgi:enoyl-CoA hydratase
VAGDGAAALLPNLVSLTKAKELLFFSREISGRDLGELGIANRVVPRAELDVVVRDAAAELARQPREALRWTKLVLNKCAENTVSSVLDAAVAFEGWTWELPPFKRMLAEMGEQ